MGVVKLNRMAGAVLKSKKEMQKEGRGYMDRRVSKTGEVVLVRWHDNNSVNGDSAFVGIVNIDTVQSWSAKDKKFIRNLSCFFLFL